MPFTFDDTNIRFLMIDDLTTGRRPVVPSDFGAGGWAPFGNVGVVCPHGMRGGGSCSTGFASGNMTFHTPFFRHGNFSRVRGILFNNNATPRAITGMVAAAASRVDQTAGSPGHFVYPDNGAGGAGTWVQLTFGNSPTTSTPATTTVDSQLQPNYLLGDWVDLAHIAPAVDATNNPRECNILHARLGFVTDALYYSGGCPDSAGQVSSLTSYGIADVGVAERIFYKAEAGLVTAATAHDYSPAFTQWGEPYQSAFALEVECSVPVLNVLLADDSIGNGATAAGGSGRNLPYFHIAVRKASTPEVPMFPISVAWEGGPESYFCEAANRFITQVRMPDVLVTKASRNGGWTTTNLNILLDLADTVREAGGQVVLIAPLPDSGGAALRSLWNAYRLALHNYAEANGRVRVLDPSLILGDVATAPDVPINPTWTGDNIHPNYPGHRVISEMLYAALSSIRSEVLAAA